MLAVLTASTLISIQSSRPTQAESLLYNATCVVVSLLNRECKPSVPPASPSNSAQPAPTSSSSPQSGEPASSTAPSSATTPPLEVSETLKGEIPSIPQLDGVTKSGIQPPFNYSAYVLGVNNDSSAVGTLGEVSKIPFRTSAEGWKIIGVAWYWWLVAVVGIVGLFYIIKQRVLNSL